MQYSKRTKREKLPYKLNISLILKGTPREKQFTYFSEFRYLNYLILSLESIDARDKTRYFMTNTDPYGSFSIQ